MKRQSRSHVSVGLEGSRRQLFTVIQDVEVPSEPDYDNETGTYTPSPPDKLPAMVFMQWPDGFPCVEMELYLMWLAHTGSRLDNRGGSVRQEAVKLSHFVRYCYSCKMNFWELRSKNFSDFLFQLAKDVDKDGINIREPNQVIEISDSCIRFLMWVQDYLLPHRRIVDVENKPHQIELILRTTVDKRNRSRKSLHFFKNPAPSSRQLKRPVPKESIDKLFWIILARSDYRIAHPKYARKFGNEENLKIYLDFQRKTWEAIISIFLAIGCRPAELADMKVSDNLEALTFKKSIILPTKKREPEASRIVPIVMNLVIRLRLYIKARGDYLDHLRRSSLNPEPSDAVFINAAGYPMTKETITHGFRRLCKDGGIIERTCISMFRHRAITTLVALHLKEFVSSRSDEVIHAMNDSDYSTILAKVASITGHKDPESLRPYIDLAWEELGKFDAVRAAMALHTLMLTALHELAPGLEQLEHASLDEKEEWFRDRVRWFRLVTDDMKESVEVFRYLKVDPRVQSGLTA